MDNSTIYLKNNYFETSQKIQWELKKFSLIKDSEKDYVSEEKPLFDPENKNEICKWHLEVNFTADEIINFSFEVDEVERSFFASGTCWILNRDKDLCNEKKILLTKFSENSYANLQDDDPLIDKEEVFNPANKYLGFDDSLTLVFEVNFKIDYPETSDKPKDKSKQESAILSYFGSLFNNEELSDVVILMGDEKFYGHKLILSAFSKYFAGMFRNFKESSENVIKISEPDHRLFKEVLRFIYTKEFNETMEHTDTLEVLRLANKYAVDELNEACEKILTKSLKNSNCIDLLVAADSNQLLDLKAIIIDYISGNINQIMKSKEWVALKKEAPQLVIEVTSAAISKK